MEYVEIKGKKKQEQVTMYNIGVHMYIQEHNVFLLGLVSVMFEWPEL